MSLDPLNVFKKDANEDFLNLLMNAQGSASGKTSKSGSANGVSYVPNPPGISMPNHLNPLRFHENGQSLSNDLPPPDYDPPLPPLPPMAPPPLPHDYLPFQPRSEISTSSSSSSASSTLNENYFSTLREKDDYQLYSNFFSDGDIDGEQQVLEPVLDEPSQFSQQPTTSELTKSQQEINKELDDKLLMIGVKSRFSKCMANYIKLNNCYAERLEKYVYPNRLAKVEDRIGKLNSLLEIAKIDLFNTQDPEIQREIELKIKGYKSTIYQIRKDEIAFANKSIEYDKEINACAKEIKKIQKAKFHFKSKKEIAQQLIDLHVRYQNLIEKKLQFFSYQNGYERLGDIQKHRKSLDRLVEIARKYPELRPENIDEGYRSRSKQHVANSLEKQKASNVKQQAMQHKGNGFAKATDSEVKSIMHSIKLHEAQGVNETGQLKVGLRSVGFSSRQGLRKEMEDAHLMTNFVININDNIYPVGLYAILDGHGGELAAQFAKDMLPSKIDFGLKLFNPEGLTDDGIWKALKWASTQVSEDIKASGEKSGTTAAICLEIDNQLWIANVGDCRVILDNNGEIQQLSEDAKAEDSKYTKGIEKRGGKVDEEDRINSHLKVGRSIGDRLVGKGVSAAPKNTKEALDGIVEGKRHLILACDGVWDVAETDEVGELVHNLGDESVEYKANAITENALKSGSKDNVSAMVIEL